jgi:hypothetical protein
MEERETRPSSGMTMNPTRKQKRSKTLVASVDLDANIGEPVTDYETWVDNRSANRQLADELAEEEEIDQRTLFLQVRSMIGELRVERARDRENHQKEIEALREQHAKDQQAWQQESSTSRQSMDGTRLSLVTANAVLKLTKDTLTLKDMEDFKDTLFRQGLTSVSDRNKQIHDAASIYLSRLIPDCDDLHELQHEQFFARVIRHLNKDTTAGVMVPVKDQLSKNKIQWWVDDSGTLQHNVIGSYLATNDKAFKDFDASYNIGWESSSMAFSKEGRARYDSS